MRPENNSDPGLHLLVTPESLDDFCTKIISRSRNISHTHEALTVLQAFIAAFSSDSQGTKSYQQLHEHLIGWTNQTRQHLLDEKTLLLVQALTNHRCDQLAELYHSLSRNGFYQILALAIDKIPAETVDALYTWIINWSDDARQKAEQASGYPDALDFIKANINIEEYQVMSDMAHFINSRT